MRVLISVFAVHVNPVLTAFDSRGFAFDVAADQDQLLLPPIVYGQSVRLARRCPAQ
jgi:hypothetical protein